MAEMPPSRALETALQSVSDMDETPKELKLNWQYTNNGIEVMVGLFYLHISMEVDPHYDCWDCLITHPKRSSDILICGDRFRSTIDAQHAAEKWLRGIGASITSAFGDECIDEGVCISEVEVVYD